MALEMTDALRVELDKCVKKFMRKRNVKGVSAAVVGVEGPLYEATFGVVDAEGTPNDPDKKMMIGSNTKLLTALAILTLVEKGKLELDKDIGTYLSGFEIRSRFPEKAITIRQILSHTSGLSCDSFSLLMDEDACLNDILPFLSESYLIAEPGTMPAYSNIGFGVLGLIIEACSGKTYTEYLETAVLTPLGLSVEILETKAKREAAKARISGCFDKKGKPVEDALGAIISAGSNTYASLRDMERFLLFFLAPEKQTLLKPETLMEMFLPPREGDLEQRAIKFNLGLMHDYFHFNHLDAGAFTGHGGSTATHHSVFHWLKAHGLGFTVLTNSTKGMFAAREIQTTMAVACLKALGVHVPKKKPPVPLKQEPTEVNTAKTYVGNGLKIPVKTRKDGQKDMKLSFMRARLRQAEDGLFRLQPRGVTRFPLFALVLKMLRFGFTSAHGRDVCLIEQRMPYGSIVTHFAEACEAVPLPDDWKKAKGSYELRDAPPALKKALTKMKLSIVKGDPLLKMTILQQPGIMHLKALGDGEAIVRGYGRNAGETVRIEHIDGDTHLTFMGMRLKKKR